VTHAEVILESSKLPVDNYALSIVRVNSHSGELFLESASRTFPPMKTSCGLGPEAAAPLQTSSGKSSG
jgi:hypothetical protein